MPRNAQFAARAARPARDIHREAEGEGALLRTMIPALGVVLAPP